MGERGSKFITLLLSLFTAFLIWVYASGASDNMAYSKIANVQISAVNTDSLTQNDFVVNLSSKTVDSIRVYGKSSQIKSLNNKNVTASVNLADVATEGTYSLPVSIEGIPNDVSIVEIEPDTISAVVEKRGSRNISRPIIKYSGSLSDGYSIISTSSNVDEVGISGAQTNVNKVNAIIGTVDINGKKETFSSSVTLQAVDVNNEEVADVEITPSKANITINIGRSKSVPIKIKTGGKVGKGYRVTAMNPSTENVRVTGSDKALDKIESISTKSINLGGVTSSFTKKVKLDIPDGIAVTEDGSDSIIVEVRIDRNRERSIAISSFTFENLQTGYEASVEDDNVQIVLSGSNKVLDSIDPASLVGTLDLSGLTSGEHKVSIIISTQKLPDGVSIKSVSKDSVKVKITRGNRN